MKKLPIGLQDFGELRKGGYLYIDKTELIYQLVTQGKYYRPAARFLSRPRRFGKSLLVSTLSALFQSNQALFEELWVHDHWDWTKTYPVLDFRFNKASYKVSGLETFLYEELADRAAIYGITLKKSSYPAQLEELVVKLSQHHGQVVVLIDEYDKPILDYLDELSTAKENREILKNFYSVLKPLDPHLRFVLLTGVSKFSRVSIFSELNNLLYLTLHPDYATLLGYTQQELEHYFADRIKAAIPKFGGQQALLQSIKEWYNGYTWDAEHHLYNPFSILSFFSQKQFANFWFETGTPTFLVKLLKHEWQYDLDNSRVNALVLSAFELERIDPHALLFQTGYLTIGARQDQLYTLTYPNQEVRVALVQYLLAEYSSIYPSQTSTHAQQLHDALQAGSIEHFAQALNSLFASIPYQIFIADKEAYRRATPYHSVTFLALSLVGTFIQVEVSQAKGRSDAVVHTEQVIYVLEFKLDESAEAALAQIKEKGYAQPYLAQGKAVRALGFNFSAEQKAIEAWQEEVIVKS